MDWKQRQKECKKCMGYGYTASEAKHADGNGTNAWAARCECQPRTVQDLEEAAAQERQAANDQIQRPAGSALE